MITCRIQNPDTLRAGRVGAAHGGAASGAGLGRTECRRDDPARGQPCLLPSSVSRTHSRERSSEAQTNKKPNVNLSNPKTENTTGASGRCARRSGGAGSGRTERQQNCSPRKQASLVPSKVPGHALHEKGLQRQIGVGPLVSSQKERTLLVPLIRNKPMINR